MVDQRAMNRFRFDGVEAMVFAMAFIVAVIAVMALGLVWTKAYLVRYPALALGFGAVWVLRRFRPTRVAPPRSGDNAVVGARSLGALLLLGVGWFVLAIAALFTLVAGSMLSDPKFREASVLLLPAVPLLVGSALVYAGLRVSRGQQEGPVRG